MTCYWESIVVFKFCPFICCLIGHSSSPNPLINNTNLFLPSQTVMRARFHFNHRYHSHPAFLLIFATTSSGFAQTIAFATLSLFLYYFSDEMGANRLCSCNISSSLTLWLDVHQLFNVKLGNLFDSIPFERPILPPSFLINVCIFSVSFRARDRIFQALQNSSN